MRLYYFYFRDPILAIRWWCMAYWREGGGRGEASWSLRLAAFLICSCLINPASHAACFQSWLWPAPLALRC